MRHIMLILIVCCSLLGCAKLRPYVVDVQQGNIIDQKIIDQLHPGMEKNQVLTLLGTPILSDAFNENVWVYAYTSQTNGGEMIKKVLTIEFKSNKIEKVQSKLAS